MVLYELIWHASQLYIYTHLHTGAAAAPVVLDDWEDADGAPEVAVPRKGPALNLGNDNRWQALGGGDDGGGGDDNDGDDDGNEDGSNGVKGNGDAEMDVQQGGGGGGGANGGSSDVEEGEDVGEAGCTVMTGEAAEEDEDQAGHAWACSTCTYLHEGYDAAKSRCAMCGTRQPYILQTWRLGHYSNRAGRWDCF